MKLSASITHLKELMEEGALDGSHATAAAEALLDDGGSRALVAAGDQRP